MSPRRRTFAVTIAAAAALAAPLGAPAQATPAPTTGLTPQLATAYRSAKAHAVRQGVPLWITSGKRSWAEQRELWRDGLRTYGNPEVARRWVLPPGESTHVTGRAIDVGPLPGARWLARTGSRWGLCRTYANEWWHFEVATAPGRRCPPMLPSAAQR